MRGLRAAPPLVLPRAVRSVLDAHREAVWGRLAGLDPSSVLDLDDPAAVALVLDAGVDGHDRPSFAAIVSIAALPRFADVGAAAHALRALLAPEGVIHLVEPVLHVGATARLQATLWSACPPVRGNHLERNVPLALRSNDLLITDLERFTMPTRIRPLRRFIDARARRQAPIDLVGLGETAGAEREVAVP